jgi:hypothetical protein
MLLQIFQAGTIEICLSRIYVDSARLAMGASRAVGRVRLIVIGLKHWYKATQ